MRSVEFALNPLLGRIGRDKAPLDDFDGPRAAEVTAFHRTLPGYAPTPLISLDGLAKELSVGRIWIKDESRRLGLNAFKVLGGSYAIGRILAEKLGLDPAAASFEALGGPAVRERLGTMTFVTATDGNHGRGVAWSAAKLGHKSVVFMPAGSLEIRAENIRACGAECLVTDLNYDDAVRHAAAHAASIGAVVVQDTAWEGYEDIPRWIMMGYMTLAQEIVESLEGQEPPTHVFLQAGVGSFAGAVLGRLTAAWGAKAPKGIVVEPHLANCHHLSFLAGDGAPRSVGGAMATIMAGLACGEPSSLSWPILRDYAHATVSCADHIAASGMRILSSPVGGDPRIISGESGAVPAGLLEYLRSTPAGRKVSEALGIGADSRILMISTEGDTSPETYREVVWLGRLPGAERGASDV
jgi:diaminopropionate ammonia-lyase